MLIFLLLLSCIFSDMDGVDPKVDRDEDSDYDEDLAIPEESLVTSPEGGEVTVTSCDGVDMTNGMLLLFSYLHIYLT